MISSQPMRKHCTACSAWSWHRASCETKNTLCGRQRSSDDKQPCRQLTCVVFRVSLLYAPQVFRSRSLQYVFHITVIEKLIRCAPASVVRRWVQASEILDVVIDSLSIATLFQKAIFRLQVRRCFHAAPSNCSQYLPVRPHFVYAYVLRKEFFTTKLSFP